MTVRCSRVHGNGAARITLDHPRGNILDAETVAALRHALTDAAGDITVRAIVIDAAGRDFSFGASVQEHLPDKVKSMLTGFHALLLQMLEAPVPVLVAVHGRCLGGALELALAGSRIFAGHGATLGQPEVKLGVFAPAATVLLPERVGAGVAEDLLLTGRSMNADEALTMGLIDEISRDQPAAHALQYVTDHLAPLSLNAIRFAARAAHAHRAELFRREMPALEKLYLDDLMSTRDAVEGLQAFLEARPPKWSEAR